MPKHIGTQGRLNAPRGYSVTELPDLGRVTLTVKYGYYCNVNDVPYRQTAVEARAIYPVRVIGCAALVHSAEAYTLGRARDCQRRRVFAMCCHTGIHRP